MTTLNTAFNFDCNDIAKFRLHVISVYEKQGMEVVLTAFPKISKRSVYRWRKRFNDSNRSLSSLIPKSTRPHHTREMIVPAPVLRFIKELRMKYPRLSKYKIKPYLDIYCQEQGLPTYSASWIGKVIKRYSFFFKTRKPVRRKRRTLKVKRVKYCPMQKDIKLGYLQLDGIHVVFAGRTFKFISAIELKSRQAWAKRVKSLSSEQAKLFLQEILKKIDYPIHTIQTDNGSEFEGAFDKYLHDQDIKHKWTYPNCPKINGVIERFNRSIQEEWLNMYLDEMEDLELINNRTKQYLEFYHHKRIHESLNDKTPAAVVGYTINYEKSPICV